MQQGGRQHDQDPLHDGQDHRRGQQFAQRHLPAVERINLEQIGHGEVVSVEVLGLEQQNPAVARQLSCREGADKGLRVLALQMAGCVKAVQYHPGVG